MGIEKMQGNMKGGLAAICIAGVLAGCSHDATYPGDRMVRARVSDGSIVMRAESSAFESEVDYFTRGFDDKPDSIYVWRRPGWQYYPGDAMYDSLMTFYPKVKEKAEQWPGVF